MYPNTYKPERLTVIWREVGSLSHEAFGRIVDRLIGESRFAPMLPEFREAASIEREKENSAAKKDHTRDSWEFWKGSGQASSSPEEQSWMFQAIRQRLKKEMSDDDWNAFMKLIESRFGRQAKVIV